MPSFPPMPPWEGMHPLVVHFPIALLMVAPIFVLLTALSGSRSLMIGTLLLMALGTAGAYLATSSGEEANAYVDFESMTGYEVAEEHSEVAHRARNVFAMLTAIYAVLTAVSLPLRVMRKLPVRLVLNLVFLLPWAYGLTVLADAAHLGGHLVHEFGAKAPLAESLEVVEEEEEWEDLGDTDDDDTSDDEAAGQDVPAEDARADADNQGDASEPESGGAGSSTSSEVSPAATPTRQPGEEQDSALGTTERAAGASEE